LEKRINLKFETLQHLELSKDTHVELEKRTLEKLIYLNRSVLMQPRIGPQKMYRTPPLKDPNGDTEKDNQTQPEVGVHRKISARLYLGGGLTLSLVATASWLRMRRHHFSDESGIGKTPRRNDTRRTKTSKLSAKSQQNISGRVSSS
jgi:hypothetical protein